MSTLTKILTVLLFLSISIVSNAQQWTQWQTVYAENNIQVSISFQVNAGDCKNMGYSFYKIYVSSTLPKCWLYFQFEYIDCDGDIQTEPIAVDLSKQGEDKDRGRWFVGTKINKNYKEVKFVDHR